MIRKLELELDELDYMAIQKGIAYMQRLGWSGVPDCDGGNIAGRCLAEIARGYLDWLGEWPGKEPEKEVPHDVH